MPTLSQVIDEFNIGFQYLDDNGKRKTKWYEVGFSFFSNPDLTADLEKIAVTLNSDLDDLKLNHGSETFEDSHEKLAALIIDTVKKVLVKRFVYGDLNTVNYNVSNGTNRVFDMERSITPKKASSFESMLLKGLMQVSNTYPELLQHFESIVTILKAPPNLETKVFYEHARYINGHEESHGYNMTSMKDDYHKKEVRQDYADREISQLKI